MKTDYPSSTATIDFNALDDNLQILKNRSGVHRAMVVVKVNAYNHGATMCSQFLEPLVESFAVACVNEALELRRAGVEKEILVFGVPTRETSPLYKTYNLSASMSHLDHFELLEKGTRCHLHFDTGMNRLGFLPDQIAIVQKKVDTYSSLQYRGIYSHYATADEPGSDLVKKQNRLFGDIRKNFGGLSAHMSNSAAAMLYDIDHFDMIRVGLGLYGFLPGNTQEDSLRQALTWTTRLSQVRELKKGETVSYGATWACPENGFLATIPVGYGDGIPRSLSGKLQVYIEGNFYPVVGTVTMDSSMIFLGKNRFPVNTEVTLMGSESWDAHQWAMSAGSIVHEIFCRISPRVARRYIDSNE